MCGFWLMPNLQIRLYDFTRGSVDEIMEVFVAGRCVTRPVLREPLGTEPSFQISAADCDEACALADELRVGWRLVSLVE
jgi:preprotein translocase subunit SecD